MRAARAAAWALAPAAALGFALALAVGPGPGGVEFGWPDPATPGGRALLLLRAARAAAGFVVGAGLACAGAVLQALLRNPLADPYVLGVSGGGALGAALAIASGLAAAVPGAVPLCAFVAAMATLALVYALASRGSGPSLFGLLLSGVMVSAMASSLLLLIVSLAPVEGLHSVTWWMLGSLQVHSGPMLAAAAALVAASVVVLRALARDLDALALGRELAHHLGVRTRRAVGLALAAATLAAAAAVAMSGLIGFVGLLVPHAVRHLAGPDHRRLLPACALGGGLFLVLCDTLARTLLAPVELPVGVVTALCGGPFFLYLLRARRPQGWIE